MSLHLATTDTGNALLAEDPLALLVGMLLDQHMRIGWTKLVASRGDSILCS